MCCGVTSTSSSLLMKCSDCSRLMMIGGVRRTEISEVEERTLVFCFSLQTFLHHKYHRLVCWKPSSSKSPIYRANSRERSHYPSRSRIVSLISSASSRVFCSKGCGMLCLL